MPPKGVQTLAVAQSEQQAQVVADALDVIPPSGQELLGEERCVIRVRKTPRGWEVQSWSMSALMWEAEDEADVPF